jgi:hypothetical protein
MIGTSTSEMAHSATGRPISAMIGKEINGVRRTPISSNTDNIQNRSKGPISKGPISRDLSGGPRSSGGKDSKGQVRSGLLRRLGMLPTPRMPL